jgi:hypothetical protein
LDKTKTTLISSCTILAGETTDIASCTAIDLSRTVQFIIICDGTFNASTNDGLTIHLYPSDDNSTFDGRYWHKYDIRRCASLGYDAGTVEWILGETVTAAAGGTGTVAGWSIASGSFAVNDAAGTLLLEDQTGTMSNDGALTGSVAGAATQNGSVAAYGFQNHSQPISPVPLYMKARVTNNGNQSVTGFTLAVVTMDV